MGTQRRRPGEGRPPLERRQRGAWYTPRWLADLVVSLAVEPADRRVLDPACGEGVFLAAASARCHPAAELVGVELDAHAAAVARAAVPSATVITADALALRWNESANAADRHLFDAVVGNPPFLNQLRTLTSRGGASRYGGGPYADAAAEFLALAARLVRPGGRVGMILPASLLSARDAAGVRRELLEHGAITHLWSTDERVFDAQVAVCAIAWQRGAQQGPVRRTVTRRDGVVVGVDSVPFPSVGLPETTTSDASWSTLLTHGNVPSLDGLRTAGALRDRAAATADFRDQYYGLVGHVSDEADGPPLVTSGIIDPAHCAWGERPVRFGGKRFAAPRVALSDLDERMRAWACRRLVPKVLVATQTAVLEVVVDADGRWLPSVPVVTVEPLAPSDLWRIAAVLSSPVASAVLAHRRAGSGMGLGTLRVRASDLLDLPWPAGERSLEHAAGSLRRGDLLGTARAIGTAFGTDSDALVDWWLARLPRGAQVSARGRSGSPRPAQR
jgi:SAM-dependent methyltransferase